VTVPVKEMTYLFAIISVAVINALSSKKVSYMELLFVNLGIISILYLLDVNWFAKQQGTKMLIYEKIENIKPQNRDALLADLRERTGMDITDVEIDRVNYLNDSARIKIHYNPDPQERNYSRAGRTESER